MPLRAGADVGAEERDRYDHNTAPEAASENGQDEIVELNAGAHFDARETTGHTPARTDKNHN